MAKQSWFAAIGLTIANAAGSMAASASTQAPPSGPGSLYCLRVEAATGSRVEAVRCWTRGEWAYQGVDVDKEWPREGVRVIER